MELLAPPEEVFLGGSFAILIAGTVLPLIIYQVMNGMLVLAAYDAKVGRPIRPGTYVTSALKRLLPLIVMAILVYVLIMTGFALLIVPGLWVLGVTAVFVPAVMIEGAGFGAIGRSARLTKGYRRPVVLFIVVVYIIESVVAWILGDLVAIFGGAAFLLIAQGLFSGVANSIVSIALAMTYARLREIKEGVGFADLADVFA
ncbi:hypothetical protein [Afifella marina]|uniref:Glycerophosphoryl diester phosphodiesterase membrane domain-containing protein n=1 Tax=Afifella marina DSM 2698 TaxID=1120955 RepID=A0A1G5P9U2_AFIMA|nr:hypothetical protein [Afifella marina]MBK1625411.1 hypothetical protein [Afifella marina DSM 2698]MBK1629033.1 hypothetical protein [Afifella marina]MBK5918009.1 hypothetical protein [Afifella marina]RAI17562.1 hypothetical protein CH311_17965 [Afifella marina DSM 2698]SCZ46337.1 hypothetical protein SAMN03080610_03634 [Afifella marina DSM 2698]